MNKYVNISRPSLLALEAGKYYKDVSDIYFMISQIRHTKIVYYI